MPSAAQIRARKAFVKKYAKKGKRSKGSRTLSGKRRIDDIDSSFPSPKNASGNLNQTRKRMRKR